jgi:glycosyltransferase involved in cell wall biosynthesis
MRRFLFIHQNFPGQFGHVARALAAAGNAVVALGIHAREVPGVRVLRYGVKPPQRSSEVGEIADFEVKVVRGLACLRAMQRLHSDGFMPDVIVAHPGWGEALFCRDVWPRARLLIFSEFFYTPDDADSGFDPEFGEVDLAARVRLRIKNTALLHALAAADGGYAPTRWQHSRIPAEYRGKFEVAFDGIDTREAAPGPTAWVQLSRAGVRLKAADEVITFVNRNLEPYRGFHIFMRMLPEVLRRRPQAHVLIVGGDEVSYGQAPAGGGTWRRKMLEEVGAELPAERVHFLGRLPRADYLRVLQVSACHVYMTYPFVLSWSCVEALSAGCVVVGSRTTPVEEVIEDGVNGFLVDFFDVKGWAERICSVLEYGHDHSGIRREARSRVVSRYDLNSVSLPELINLINS